MQRATAFAVILAMFFSATMLWSTAQEESTAKETVHITLFDDQVEDKFLGMLEWFTAETGWPAEVVPAPGGQDYFTTNATRLATGEGPDILIGHGTPAEYLVYNPKQNFVDITDWARDNLVGTKVPEAVMAANAVDGRNFGIPYSPITLRGYLYNKELAQAAGVTVPASTGDFIDNVAPKVRAAGFDPLYAMGQSAWSLGFVADNFIADEFVLTDVQDRINNNETSFAETGMVRAFEYIKEIGDRGFSTPMRWWAPPRASTRRSAKAPCTPPWARSTHSPPLPRSSTTPGWVVSTFPSRETAPTTACPGSPTW